MGMTFLTFGDSSKTSKASAYCGINSGFWGGATTPVILKLFFLLRSCRRPLQGVHGRGAGHGRALLAELRGAHDGAVRRRGPRAAPRLASPRAHRQGPGRVTDCRRGQQKKRDGCRPFLPSSQTWWRLAASERRQQRGAWQMQGPPQLPPRNHGGPGLSRWRPRSCRPVYTLYYIHLQRLC